MHVEIDAVTFKKLIESVKGCVSVKDYRDYLTFIKVKVEKDKLTAMSCDGSRAALTTINIAYDGDPFEGYIKPLTLKPIEGAVVIIDQVDNTTSVDVPTEFGSIQYRFANPKNEFPDVEKICNDSVSRCTYKTGVNPELLAQCCKSLKSITGSGQAVVLNTSENPLHPIVMKAKSDNLESTQIVLPMRIHSWD